PGSKIWDRGAWAQGNPALGHGHNTERVIAAAAATDPEWVFRTEVLCQWPEGTITGVFPTDAWASIADEDSKADPEQRMTGCLALSGDRSRAHIAIAGVRPDGLTKHVGVVASRAGTGWIGEWLKSDQAPPIDTLVIQARGAPESSLIEELRREGIKVT